MEKKNKWIKKGILIVVLLLCIAAYLWIPGVHSAMNRVFKMFAKWGLHSCKRFCRIVWSLCSTDFISADDISVYCSTASCIFDYICQCKSVWMVERCNSFME